MEQFRQACEALESTLQAGAINFRQEFLENSKNKPDNSIRISVNDFIKQLTEFKNQISDLYSGKDLEQVVNALNRLQGTIENLLERFVSADRYIQLVGNTKNGEIIINEVLSNNKDLGQLFKDIIEINKKGRTPVFNQPLEDIPLARSINDKIQTVTDRIVEDYQFTRRAELQLALASRDDAGVSESSEDPELSEVLEIDNNTNNLEGDKNIRKASLSSMLLGAMGDTKAIVSTIFGNDIQEKSNNNEETEELSANVEDNQEQNQVDAEINEDNMRNLGLSPIETDPGAAFLISEACKIFKCTREELIKGFGLNFEEYNRRAMPLDYAMAIFFEVIYQYNYGLDKQFFIDQYAGIKNAIDEIKSSKK